MGVVVNSFPYVMPVTPAALGTPNSIGEAGKLSKCSQGAQSEYLPASSWNGGPCYRIRPPNQNEGYGGLGGFNLGGLQSPRIFIRACVKAGSGVASLPDTSKWMYIKSAGPGNPDSENRVVPWWWAASSRDGQQVITAGHCDWQSGGMAQRITDQFRIGGSPPLPARNLSGRWYCLEIGMVLDAPSPYVTAQVTTADGAWVSRTMLDTSRFDLPDFEQFWSFGSTIAGALYGKTHITEIEGIGYYWFTQSVQYPLALNSSHDILISDVVIDTNPIGPPTGFTSQRMNRYYVCRRLGTGVPGANDPYRSELQSWLAVNYPDQCIPSRGYVGHVFGWCLQRYNLTQEAHDSAMANVPTLFSLPSIDRTVGSLSPSVRNDMANKLDACGFDMTWVSGATTIAEVISYIVQSCEVAEWLDIQIGSKAFDIRNKTVNDVPAEKRGIILSIAGQYGVDLSGTTTTTPLHEVVQRFMGARLRDGRPPLYTDN